MKIARLRIESRGVKCDPTVIVVPEDGGEEYELPVRFVSVRGESRGPLEATVGVYPCEVQIYEQPRGITGRSSTLAHRGRLLPVIFPEIEYVTPDENERGRLIEFAWSHTAGSVARLLTRLCS